MKKYRSQAFPAKVDIKSGVTRPPRVEITSEEEIGRIFREYGPQIVAYFNRVMFDIDENGNKIEEEYE